MNECDIVKRRQIIKKGPQLIIITGPSGGGKTTLRDLLLKHHPKAFAPSVSFTTRQPRTGEIEGKSYYFVSEEKFDDLIRQRAFLEYATVHGKRYGTPKAAVIEKLGKGKKVILAIDVQGFDLVRKAGAFMNRHLLSLFIRPPTIEDLRNRLHKRAELDGVPKKELHCRLAAAPMEMAREEQFDYIIESVTDNPEGDYHQAIEFINEAMENRKR